MRKVLDTHKARFVGEDHQVDTYFRVPKGRLKLREGTIERALIYYEREDQHGPKASQVLLHTPTHDNTLKALLTTALGIRVVVEKWREIYFVDNVKIHLDRVERLGTFVEIEAIDTDGTWEHAGLHQQCVYFMHQFEIKAEALCTGSYAEMLEALG